MIDSIEISITSLNNKMDILINVKEEKIITPFKEKSISKDEIQRLVRIIRSWRGEYINTSIVDAERFKIIISFNGQKEVITGSGTYPDNYLEFKNFVGEYYE